MSRAHCSSARRYLIERVMALPPPPPPPSRLQDSFARTKLGCLARECLALALALASARAKVAHWAPLLCSRLR